MNGDVPAAEAIGAEPVERADGYARCTTRPHGSPMSNATTLWILSVHFPKQLVALRKERGLTQQALADGTGLHVNQIKRYEAGSAQPTLDALTRLARQLHVSLDELVFAEGERGPSDDLKLQFEAISQFPPEEMRVVKEVIEGLIIKYQSRRWDSGRQSAA